MKIVIGYIDFEGTYNNTPYIQYVEYPCQLRTWMPIKNNQDTYLVCT